MRILPSGTAALLIEVDDLDQVLALHAGLRDRRLPGVVDLVPAGRTVLVVVDPERTTTAALAEEVRRTDLLTETRATTLEPLEVPVTYDGEDLGDVADLLRCDPEEVVRRHTEERWTVGFCGFAPGFGYLVGSLHRWDVPRRPSPRTSVPAGSVALAGEFSGVYPRSSPGGWQLLGRTDLAVADLDRDPPFLLVPGREVRFVDAGGR